MASDLAQETAEEELQHLFDEACDTYIQDRIAQHTSFDTANHELELLITVELMNQISQRSDISPLTNIHNVCEKTQFALKNLAVFAGSQLEGSSEFPTLASITEHLAHIYVGVAVNAMKQAGVAIPDMRKCVNDAIDAGLSTRADGNVEAPGMLRQ